VPQNKRPQREREETGGVLIPQGMGGVALFKQHEKVLKALFGDPLKSDKQTASGKAILRFTLDTPEKQQALENLRLSSKKWAHILGEKGIYEFVYHIAIPITLFEQVLQGSCHFAQAKKNTIYKYQSVLVKNESELARIQVLKEPARPYCDMSKILKNVIVGGMWETFRLFIDDADLIDLSHARVSRVAIGESRYYDGRYENLFDLSFKDSTFGTIVLNGLRYLGGLDFSGADIDQLLIENTHIPESDFSKSVFKSLVMHHVEKFEPLDFSQSTFTDLLEIKDSSGFQEIYFPKNKPIETLVLKNLPHLTQLDLSEVIVSKELNITNNNITSLSLSGGIFGTVDFEGLASLRFLDLSDVRADELTIQGLKNLESIQTQKSVFNTFSLDSANSLRELDLSQTEVNHTLKVVEASHLEKLSLPKNKLFQNVEMDNLPMLTSLDLSQTTVGKSLQISSWSALKKLDLSGGKFFSSTFLCLRVPPDFSNAILEKVFIAASRRALFDFSNATVGEVEII